MALFETSVISKVAVALVGMAAGGFAAMNYMESGCLFGSCSSGSGLTSVSSGSSCGSCSYDLLPNVTQVAEAGTACCSSGGEAKAAGHACSTAGEVCPMTGEVITAVAGTAAATTTTGHGECASTCSTEKAEEGTCCLKTKAAETAPALPVASNG